MLKILSIGTDKTICDQETWAYKRQVAYYTGMKAYMFILGTGEPVRLTEGDLTVILVGGGNKFTALAKTLAALFRLARQEKLSLIVSQDVQFTGIVGQILSAFFKVPHVTQLHGDYLDNPLWISQRKINVVLNFIGKRMLKEVAGVRVVSERIKKQVVNDFQIDEGKVLSLPIGTDLSIFSHTQQREREQIVLFIGRLIDEKSPLLYCQIMVDFFQKNDSARAVIIGEGEIREEMEAIFARAGFQSRAQFAGKISQPEIADWCARSYCLLHTAAWEGWGMPMIEAMASGCPVVTTDTGCAGEAVIQRRNGLIFPVDDKDQARQYLEELFADKKLHSELARNCIQDASHWSFSEIAKKINQFYVQYAQKI